MDSMTAGIITAIGIIFVVMKLNSITLRRLLAYDFIIDVVVTAGLIVLLKGTNSGLQTAMLSGAILSIILFVTKAIIGYEKMIITKGKPKWVRHSIWSNK